MTTKEWRRSRSRGSSVTLATFGYVLYKIFEQLWY